MAVSTTCGLWVLILTTSLTITGSMGADPTYTVGTVLVEGFTMQRENRNGDVQYYGYIPDLLRKLGEIVGADFKITLQPDGKFGSPNADGSWDGLMGSLVRNDIDMAAAPFTITSRRSRVMDFSKRFMSTGLVMVISGPERGVLPSPPKSSVGFILQPFSDIVWLTLIAAVLIIIVFSIIIHCLSVKEEKTGDSVSPSNQLITCSKRGQCSRSVLRITVLLFVLLTVALYTSQMVHLHPVEVVNSHTQGIDDIVNSGRYKIPVVRGGATDYFFKTTTVFQYERIYSMLTYVENVSAGIDLVHKDPGYVFITDKALAEYYMSRKPYCNLDIVGAEFTSTGYGLGLPLGSKLRDIVDLSILQLQEEGTLEKLQKKWWYDLGQCRKRHKAPTKNYVRTHLDSITFGGVLIILVIGLLVAVGVAVIERFIKRRKSPKDSHLNIHHHIGDNGNESKAKSAVV